MTPGTATARLTEIRRRISEVDLLLVSLLAERGGLAREARAIKEDVFPGMNLPRRDPAQEAVVLRRVREANPGPYSNAALERVWGLLFEESDRLA